MFGTLLGLHLASRSRAMQPLKILFLRAAQTLDCSPFMLTSSSKVWEKLYKKYTDGLASKPQKKIEACRTGRSSELREPGSAQGAWVSCRGLAEPVNSLRESCASNE